MLGDAAHLATQFLAQVRWQLHHDCPLQLLLSCPVLLLPLLLPACCLAYSGH